MTPVLSNGDENLQPRAKNAYFMWSTGTYSTHFGDSGGHGDFRDTFYPRKVPSSWSKTRSLSPEGTRRPNDEKEDVPEQLPPLIQRAGIAGRSRTPLHLVQPRHEILSKTQWVSGNLRVRSLLMSYDHVLFALKDPTRRLVLSQLRMGPKSVTQIASNLKVSRPAVSQHLYILWRAKLVSYKGAGRQNYYRLDKEGLDDLRDYLDGLYSVIRKYGNRPPSK
jgi:DNA-binding transcriptional ArsR family regulator